jgi:hypothetical protein
VPALLLAAATPVTDPGHVEQPVMDPMIHAQALIIPHAAFNGAEIADEAVIRIKHFFLLHLMREIKMVMNIRDGLSLTLFMLSLNLVAGNLGALSSISYRFFALILMLILVVLNKEKLSYKKSFKKSLDLLGIILMASGFIVLLLPNREYWLLSLPMILAGLGLGSQEGTLFLSVSFGGTIYALFYIIQKNVAHLHALFTTSSREYTHLVGILVNHPMSFGSYVSGLWVVICFSLLLTSNGPIGPRAKILFKGAAGLLASLLLFSVLQSNFSNQGYLINMQPALFFLCMIPLIYVMQNCSTALPYSLSFLKVNALLLIILFISVFSLSHLSYISDVPPTKGNILFYERNSALTFDAPRFPEDNETFSSFVSLSIGELSVYLEKMGYEVKHFKNPTKETLGDALKEADVIMLLDLTKSLSKDEREAIWDFVKGGGGLLVFGEHTSMFVNDTEFERGQDYLNEILQPTGIAVNPDTADWIASSNWWTSGGWYYPLDISPHPFTLGLDESTFVTTSVGASLGLSGSAKALVMAPWGLSDAANASMNGRLGNRSYDPGEQLGDIVIVAEDHYGKGRVLVVGDTSYVFNEALPQKERLLENIFSWIDRRDDSIAPWLLQGLQILSALCIMASIFLMVLRRDKLVMALCPFVVVLALMANGLALHPSVTKAETLGDLACIDYGHGNLLSVASAKADSIDGLNINLMRSGYLPLIARDLSRLNESKIMVVISPMERYTLHEANVLESFVSNGGLLILSVGYDEKGNVENVLKAFALDVLNIPLGSYPWAIEYRDGSLTVPEEDLARLWHKPKFMECYPVTCRGNFTPYSSVFYGSERYDLIIKKVYGKGAVALIGDSRYLLNENLEDLENPHEIRPLYLRYWLGNIELLRDILAEGREQEGEQDEIH